MAGKAFIVCGVGFTSNRFGAAIPVVGVTIQAPHRFMTQGRFWLRAAAKASQY